MVAQPGRDLVVVAEADPAAGQVRSVRVHDEVHHAVGSNWWPSLAARQPLRTRGGVHAASLSGRAARQTLRLIWVARPPSARARIR
jgi:hypothetical protein